MKSNGLVLDHCRAYLGPSKVAVKSITRQERMSNMIRCVVFLCMRRRGTGLCEDLHAFIHFIF